MEVNGKSLEHSSHAEVIAYIHKVSIKYLTLSVPHFTRHLSSAFFFFFWFFILFLFFCFCFFKQTTAWKEVYI